MKKSQTIEPKADEVAAASESPAANEPTAAAAADVPPAIIDPANVTPEQLEELKTLAAKADENWQRLLRTTADFDNFKKRAAREKQDAIRGSLRDLRAPPPCRVARRPVPALPPRNDDSTRRRKCALRRPCLRRL